MTKKQLTEKWQDERSKAAGEASKLNVKLAGLKLRAKRLKHDPQVQGLARNTQSQLMQVAARVVTIDQFLKDI